MKARKFTSEPFSLRGVVCRAFGREVTDLQQLEHFGTPCTLDDSTVEIDHVEELETGREVVHFDAGAVARLAAMDYYHDEDCNEY